MALSPFGLCGGPFTLLVLAAAAAVLLLLLVSEVHADCGRPKRIPSAELTREDPRDTFPVGTTLTYRCIPGYQPIPGRARTITCLDTSEWSEIPTFCQRRSCRLPPFDNGRIDAPDGTMLGETITFTCDEGYRRLGTASARCTLFDGKVDWDKNPPYCERIPCLPPPDIDNGRHTEGDGGEYNHGIVVIYTCFKDFSLIGSESITCETAPDGINGQWNGPAPECKVVQCPRPHIPNGGLTTSYRPTYTYGNTVMIVCDPGYTLVGNARSTCGRDNLWVPALPTCKSGVPPVEGGTTAGPTVKLTEETTITEIGPTSKPAEEETTVAEIGSTEKPKTTPTPGSNHSTAIIVGTVAGALGVTGVIIICLRYRARLKKEGTNRASSSSAESYRVVPHKTDMALEETGKPLRT